MNEALAFQTAIVAAKDDVRLRSALSEFFIKELYKAIDKGRICVPERMAVLYPIIREINDETDAVEMYWQRFENKKTNQKEKQLCLTS